MSAPCRAGASCRAAHPPSAPGGPQSPGSRPQPLPDWRFWAGGTWGCGPPGMSVVPVGPPRPADMATVDTESHCRTGGARSQPGGFPEHICWPGPPLRHLGAPPRTPHSTPEQPSCTSLTCPTLLPGSTLVLRGAGSLSFLECGLAESTGEVCAHLGVGGAPRCLSSCRSCPASSPGSARWAHCVR